MNNYLLVPGAWNGGWCWAEVASQLRREDNQVWTPTLSGLGDEPGIRPAEIGLRTHVEDVLRLLEAEDMGEVILVGHSYAGLLVREVADRVPERIAQVVLVDGWVGPTGTSIDSLAPQFFRDWVDSKTHDGVISVPPPETIGVTDPVLADQLSRAMRPQPRRTFSDPTVLTGAVDSLPCTAILCRPSGALPFENWARSIGAETVDLQAPHQAMTVEPEALANLLSKVSTRSQEVR